ncbi:hypothetical protein ACIG3E_28180 [Streptomyces sp. NPDC053474]|uniref:hypothetical protein n=1 Tax=Streptomyces sp. NPDC053474 TaxID=3365704 RepID=UPI0037CFC702
MGRPRDPAVAKAILRTGRCHLAIDGRARMTIGTVVANAGERAPPGPGAGRTGTSGW